jgi:Zn-dependent protease
VYRDGKTMHVDNITLVCCYIVENLITKQNTTYPYIGVAEITGPQLVSAVSSYVSPLSDPWQYVCIPTLPACQTRVPFSDTLSAFYTSPFGSAGPPLANLLYWVFFLNFNLAIFNALPIYPLDGGQAFSVAVKGVGGGRLSEGAVMRITSAATFVVLALLLLIVAGPYLLSLV